MYNAQLPYIPKNVKQQPWIEEPTAISLDSVPGLQPMSTSQPYPGIPQP